MEDLTRRILKEQIEEIFNSDGKRAYILSELNCHGGTKCYEINYDRAKLIFKGDIYLDYSIDRSCPNKKQFVKTYQVVDKIIDEKSNIILIAIEDKIYLQ